MRIEKQGYSHGPWRLLWDDGSQVWANEIFRHPMLGETRIQAPICGQTRAEVERYALSLLETLLSEKAHGPA